MRQTVLLLLLFGWVNVYAGTDLAPLQSLAVQDGGRVKPFDSFARESLLKLAGRASWEKEPGVKLPAIEVLADLMLGTNDWEQAKLIRCGYRPLKQKLGLTEDRNFFSFAELAGNRELERMVGELSARNERTSDMSRVESEASSLWEKLHGLQGLTTGNAIKLVPPMGGKAAGWLAVKDAPKVHGTNGVALLTAFSVMTRAYRSSDDAGLASAAAAFKSAVQRLAPQSYPDELTVKRELTYNRLHPFRLSWIFYLFSFIGLLLARGRAGRPGLFYWPGMVLFVIALGLQVYGFTLRCLIAGRPPVTNMYEVVIWMALGAAVFALGFELYYRNRIFALAAAAVSVLGLVLADNLPTVLDPSIQPLVPVLKSNYWLTVHVLTITLGYAAFMLALGLGHVVVGYYVFKPKAQAKIDELTQFNYRTMQIGVLFLTAGTILGGLWAEQSWGRFWGWDPKETWALIALLSYLVVLHGRFAGWMGGFALNVASIVCFQTIIMAAYGVNYVLGRGLHSYGFGVGGEWAVGSYVALEFLLVGLATWRYKLAKATAK